jgi:hypothetical protein
VEDSAGSSPLVEANNCLREVWDRAGAPEIAREEIVERISRMEAEAARQAKSWHHNQAGMTLHPTARMERNH